MKAVIETATGRVIFLRPETDRLVITERGLTGAIRALDIMGDTHHIELVPDNPEFVGGFWKFQGGTWSVIDQQVWDAYAQAVREKEALQQAIMTRAAAAVSREEAVRSIKVTTSTGKEFDGDEVSQGRMSRAILALQGTGLPSTMWILADNTVAQVTAAEFLEAMVLAGQEQSIVWPLPTIEQLMEEAL